MNVARPREAFARTPFLFVFRSVLGSIKFVRPGKRKLQKFKKIKVLQVSNLPSWIYYCSLDALFMEAAHLHANGTFNALNFVPYFLS